MPHGDRDREVPRRDDRDDAARRGSASRCARRGPGSSGVPRSSATRPAGVVLEEVDRLADVGVGLGPRLGALADGERGELVAALAQPRGGARRASRRARSARRRAPSRAKPRAAARRRASTSAARRARGATRRRGRGRRGRSRRARRRRAGRSPIHTGTRSGSRGVERPAGRRASVSRVGARRSSRTGSLANGASAAHGAASSSSSGAAARPARRGTTRCSCSRAAGARGRPCPATRSPTGQ